MKRAEFEQGLYDFCENELKTLYDLKFNPNADDELRRTAEYNYEVKKLEWPKTLVSNYEKLDPATEGKVNIFVNAMANDIDEYLRLTIAIENHERDTFSNFKAGDYKSYEDNLKSLDLIADKIFSSYEHMQKEVDKTTKGKTFLSKVGHIIKFKKSSQNTLSADDQPQRQ